MHMNIETIFQKGNTLKTIQELNKVLIVMTTEQELQLAYNAAKKRSSELSALAIDSPEKYRANLIAASKTYLSISTILYASMTIPIISDLEKYVHKTGSSLPKSLFDPNEWSTILLQAGKYRSTYSMFSLNLENAKIHLENNIAKQTESIAEIKEANKRDLEILRNSMEAIKAQTINALKSMEVQTVTVENNFLVKELQYKEEIHRLKERIQQLKNLKDLPNDLKSPNTLSGELKKIDKAWEEKYDAKVCEIEQYKNETSRAIKAHEMLALDQTRKILQIQEIFTELEKFSKSKEEIRENTRLTRSMRDNENVSDKEWVIEEFYNKAASIQNVLNNLILAERTLEKSKSAIERIEEFELRKKLSDMEVKYRQLEDQFEESEVESFKMAKDLAQKNYQFYQIQQSQLREQS